MSNEDNKKVTTPASPQGALPPNSMGGGGGDAPAFSEPVLVMSAPAGMALLTPQSASLSAGATTAIAAGQDINLMAQGHAGHSVKDGISMFTYGKATNPDKPNQETGIKLHAASGKVSSQSQSSKTQVTADKAITVASTTDAVNIQAKDHVLLTTQGAYIKMDGMNIEICAPGMVKLMGSMKSFTSGQSDSNSLSLAKASALTRYNEAFVVKNEETGEVLPHAKYRIEDAGGNVLAQGIADELGQTQRVHTGKSQPVKLFLLDN